MEYIFALSDITNDIEIVTHNLKKSNFIPLKIYGVAIVEAYNVVVFPKDIQFRTDSSGVMDSNFIGAEGNFSYYRWYFYGYKWH